MTYKIERVVNITDTSFNEDSIQFEFYDDGDVAITVLEGESDVFTVVVKKDKLYKELGVKGDSQ